MTAFLGKPSIMFLAVTIVISSAFSVTAQRSNFSGAWKLDASKSELGQFAGRAAISVKAEQKDDAITVSRTTPGFNGGDPITSTVALTYDGKVTESEGFGAAKRRSTAKWSDDGKTLTISSNMTFERDGQSFEVKSTEIWTLTSDGLLSIVTNSSSPRGESTIKAVYTK